jgi:hypothetical protein
MTILFLIICRYLDHIEEHRITQLASPQHISELDYIDMYILF